jgi:hypothetical protein
MPGHIYRGIHSEEKKGRKSLQEMESPQSILDFLASPKKIWPKKQKQNYSSHPLLPKAHNLNRNFLQFCIQFWVMTFIMTSKLFEVVTKSGRTLSAVWLLNTSLEDL